jgi:hypothetical protein
MFSRQPKDNQPQDPFPQPETKIQETVVPPANSSLEKPPELEVDKPEIVIIVEKLSSILSPYFIVLVGLYLYDNDSLFSFLFGTILIATGVISILKISGRDINNFLESVKKTLGYDQEIEDK